MFLVNRFTQRSELGQRGFQKDSLHANELLGKDLTVEFSSSTMLRYTFKRYLYILYQGLKLVFCPVLFFILRDKNF